MKLISIAILVLLASCGGNDKVAEQPEKTTPAFDGLHDPIHRAEDVERQVMEQKERMDEALKAAEGGPEEPER